MKVWIAIWAVSISLPLTWMAAKHTGVLQTPGATRHLDATGRWRTIHVLVAGCGCSRRIADALSIAAPASADEEIWWVGETGPGREFPWAVRRMDGLELRRSTGLTGGPALLLADPNGAIRYGGGYPEADLTGRELVAKVRRGVSVASSRLRGCAATKEI